MNLDSSVCLAVGGELSAEDAFMHQQRLLAAKRMAAGSADPAELIEAQDMVVLYGGTTLRRRAVRQVHRRPGLRRRQRMRDGQVRRRHQQVLTPSDTCADAAKGEMETDVDCGGPQCVSIGLPCALTKECAANADCASGICDTTAGTPVCVSCADSLKNKVETDVDCGGGTCTPCFDGLDCLQASDCTSTQCEANKCTSCFNGVKDSVETGANCGGATCAATCVIGVPCAADGDCSTGKCDGVTNLCRTLTPHETCTDTTKALLETEVDCGGKECRGAGYTCAGTQACAEEECAEEESAEKEAELLLRAEQLGSTGRGRGVREQEGHAHLKREPYQ